MTIRAVEVQKPVLIRASMFTNSVMHDSMNPHRLRRSMTPSSGGYTQERWLHSACMAVPDAAGLTDHSTMVIGHDLFVRHPNAAIATAAVETVAKLLLLPLPRELVYTITRRLSRK